MKICWNEVTSVPAEVVVTSIGQPLESEARGTLYVYMDMYTCMSRTAAIVNERRYLTSFLSRELTIKIRSDNLICFAIRVEFFFQAGLRIHFCPIRILPCNATHRNHLLTFLHNFFLYFFPSMYFFRLHVLFRADLVRSFSAKKLAATQDKEEIFRLIFYVKEIEIFS